MSIYKNTNKILKEVRADIKDLCYRLRISQKQLIGRKIGEGSYRQVHECPHNPKWVVKIEHHQTDEDIFDFANIKEFTFYREWYNRQCPGQHGYSPATVRHILSWLAPCYNISHNGRILIQQKVRPVSWTRFSKQKIPAWLQYDPDHWNFGWYKGKIVCCDYATVLPKFPKKLI